ncbi:hypothetical protein FRC01_009868 [Tulasnella sp. 417]|nr:hypothetical protein FRC01_009868 [Tulasnella sp. 417]
MKLLVLRQRLSVKDSRSWKNHHRWICKDLPHFLSSTTDPQQQLDSFLEALLNATPKAAIDHLFSTIQNNHFSVALTYLHPIAHAIFSPASRALNHSCLPNAAPAYRYDNGCVRQDVRALNEIEADEEVTISYIESASPLSSRQTALRRTYGFECACSRCQLQASVHATGVPSPQHDLAKSEPSLREWVFSDHPPVLSPFAASLLPLTNVSITDVPKALLPFVYQDDYLPTLSSRFSDIAHSPKPKLDPALSTGLTLLAMYFIIYPGHHPLIGLHCPELAKVVWNVEVITPTEEAKCRSIAGELVDLARSIMTASLPSSGFEGEEGSSPWKDLQSLQGLLGGDIKD